MSVKRLLVILLFWGCGGLALTLTDQARAEHSYESAKWHDINPPIVHYRSAVEDLSAEDVSTSAFGKHTSELLGAFGLLGLASQQSCSEKLNELDWALRGSSYPELNSDRSGHQLTNLAGSENDLISWFETGGWHFLRVVDISGESFRGDRGLVFCLTRSWPMRWLTGGCRAQSGVTLLRGKIVSITAGPMK